MVVEKDAVLIWIILAMMGCPSCGKIIAFGELDESELDESISVWDVADIYLSHGCDENYSFGHTDDGLMKASGKK